MARVSGGLFDLSGRVAIVTGGAQGIGRSLAQGLAEHGADVAIADVEGGLAEQAASEIEALGVKALPVAADVTAPDEVDRMVEATVRRFGRIDILCNNAGGSGGKGGRAESLPLEYWNHTFALTVTSAFLCSQRAGRVMIERRYGRIINTASVYGLVGHDPSLYEPGPDGQPRESLAYAAAKGAMVNFTRALAVYWARHNVNVNAIAPGMVRTERLGVSHSAETWQRLAERTPLKRPGRPEDMIGAVIYLASPAADFVTGQILAVDGGWTIW
jgi:NAD(P)-dependent dehydrogenase (short-subunit alcohol dehydrogenase family)